MCYRQVKVHCYWPEVEGFRDQGFVLPEVESLRVRVCGFSVLSREEPDTSLSIVHIDDFIHKYIGRVTSCKRKIASRVDVRVV